MVLTLIAIYVAGFLFLLATLVAVFYLLPQRRRHHYRTRKTRYVLLMCTAMLFCVSVGLLSNRAFLPGAFDTASLTADLLILLATGVALWGILAYRRPARIVLPTFLVLTVALVAISIVANAGQRASDKAILHNLAALPYLSVAPDEEKSSGETHSGVVYYDSTRAYPGLNIYNSRLRHAAYLMDMTGTIVHTWEAEVPGAIPWMFMEVLPNGDLIAVVKERMLIRLDWDSNVIWTVDLAAHHDIAIAGDGRIATIVNEPAHLRAFALPLLLIDDQITFLSPDAEVLRRISFLELLKDRIPADRYLRQYAWALDPRHLRGIAAGNIVGTVFDLFHANTVEIIDRDFDKIFAKGNILFCLRNLDMIGVLNPRTTKLLWTWGPGQLQGPHHPTMLKNGHILIFDNGSRRGYSRVIELDRSTKEVVWKYRSSTPSDFYSASRGANQRLPNGNTLITHSDVGRAFEVTKDGSIVWEFYNPETIDDHRAVLYRVMRITDPNKYPCLKRLK